MPIGPAGKYPEETFTGRKVSINHVKTFSYITYVDIPKGTRGKLESIIRKTIFVGYLLISKQYKLYNPVVREVLISSVLTFVENEFWKWPDKPKEPGIDVESLDLIEPVGFDLNKLFGT